MGGAHARRLALCALLCALAALCLLLGGLVPLALYACPILAMACLLPVREEFGVRAALTAYAVTALLALLLTADKELAGVYAAWGWYPAVQPLLDRLGCRWLSLLAGVFLWSAATAALYAVLLFLFQLPAVLAEYAGASAALLAATALLQCAVCVCTDVLLRRLANLWRVRGRKRLGL